MDFRKTSYLLNIFPKFVRRVQVSLKRAKNNRYFTSRRMYLYNISQFFLKWVVFQTKLVDKIKIRISYSVTFSSENRVLYEVMYKSLLRRRGHRWQYDTAHALFMLDNWGYTNTLIKFNTYRYPPAAVVTRTRVDITSYLHCLPC